MLVGGVSWDGRSYYFRGRFERAKPEGLAYLEASWHGIDQVKIFGVEVWIVFVLFARWVVLDIEKLVVEVVGISDAMFVISAVPDCAC